jgi:hypothetical protein
MKRLATKKIVDKIIRERSVKAKEFMSYYPPGLSKNRFRANFVADKARAEERGIEIRVHTLGIER